MSQLTQLVFALPATCLPCRISCTGFRYWISLSNIQDSGHKERDSKSLVCQSGCTPRKNQSAYKTSQHSTYKPTRPMGPGRGQAERNRQQQPGRPHRMRASACASPGRAEGGTGRPPPQKKTGGEGGGARERPTATTATKPPANTTRGGPTPHPEGTEDRTPKGAQGDHPAKAGNTKPGAAAHQGKGRPKRADTDHAGTKKKKRKKRASNPA